MAALNVSCISILVHSIYQEIKNKAKGALGVLLLYPVQFTNLEIVVLCLVGCSHPSITRIRVACCSIYPSSDNCCSAIPTCCVVRPDNCRRRSISSWAHCCLFRLNKIRSTFRVVSSSTSDQLRID